jgi:hypothetical protein
MVEGARGRRIDVQLRVVDLSWKEKLTLSRKQVLCAATLPKKLRP